MWSGHLLGGQWSDQYATGYAFRHWDAEFWRATGHPPQWNPYTFAGHPTFGVFGDLFYPTAWLRLVLPTALAMDLGFVLHYVLAGFALYLLLRLLGVSWTGALTGGTAYQMSGVVVSLVSPGHDGKLFVSALLPVMLIGLVLAIRRRRVEGYPLFALGVGLALLSPQYQMTQYALLTSALFTLYLTFGEPEGLSTRERWLAIAGAGAGVVLGFGVSLIQVLPFFHYIPYSPRAEAAGYAFSTSYAMPWSHVPELFMSGFTGHYETYWGPNGLKLHSEYLGLPVIALAALGIGGPRRKLVWWLVGIGGLFLLVCLGNGTPFYRLWYALVPYVKQTRAPGMALYVVALSVSMLAAFGVERLEQGEGKRGMQIALAGAALLLLMALANVFGSIATGIARSLSVADPAHSLAAAQAAQKQILTGALGSALGLGVVAALAMTFLRGRMAPAAFAMLLIVLVGADLYRAGRDFWQWSRPEQGQFAQDPILQHLDSVARPFRLLDPPGGVYRGSTLIRSKVQQAFGESGVELRAIDDLLGGRLRWANLNHLNLWRLLGIRFLTLPDTVSVPGFHRVLGPVTTGAGTPAFLYEADSIPPYARVVPAAVKGDTGEVIPILLDPRLDYDLLVVFDRFQPVNPLPLAGQQMPAPSPSRAAFTHWAPGRMSVQLDPPPPAASYLLISENWYPDWHATVDGATAVVLRGDQTFITVPVPAGARRVELTFASRDYARGRLIMWASLVLLGMWAVAGRLLENRARRRG